MIGKVASRSSFDLRFSVAITCVLVLCFASVSSADDIVSATYSGAWPAQCGCTDYIACTYGCDEYDISVNFVYDADSSGNFETWVIIYEDDGGSGFTQCGDDDCPINGTYWGTDYYSAGTATYTKHFYDVHIGFATCWDWGDGEFGLYIEVDGNDLWNEDYDASFPDVVDAQCSVEISSLVAFAFSGRVDLRWTTSMEYDHAGWKVYRSAEPDGPFEVLHDSLLEPYQFNYSYIDYSVVDGELYYYMIEAVDIDGGTEMFGPVWAIPSAADVDGSQRVDGLDLVVASRFHGQDEASTESEYIHSDNVVLDRSAVAELFGERTSGTYE